MRADPGCAWAREELSARLDGEADRSAAAALDEHLAGCASCRRHARELEDVRRALRVQPAEAVPDLAPAIMRAVAGTVSGPGLSWRSRIRAATVGAAAAAALLLGASLPWGEGARDVAAASEIRDGVREAALGLEAYDARFEIVERGWHPLVRERRMTARVRFEAPERFRLEVRDLTPYPEGKWPRNDATVVANGRAWWIAETTSCPTAALPECSLVVRERRGIAGRQPFDGTTALPTDIVVPLETIASSGAFEVSSRAEVLGRRAHRIVLDYRSALPLVTSIQAGGSWRTFAATDRVDVWIDAETSFPLRFTVSRPERPPLLDVKATSFSVPSEFAAGTFSPPRRGTFKPGGWKEMPAGELPAGLVPGYTAGLLPYRAGTTADGKQMVTYARGMTWVKVSSGVAREGDLGYLLTAEEMKTPSGWMYYQPADESLKRRVEIFAGGRLVQVESNLSRDELLDVAASLELDGTKLPPRVTTSKGALIERLEPAEALRRAPFARRPTYVPPGYRTATVLLSRSIRETSVSFFFRRAEAEYGGSGIQVTQSKPAELLTPTSEAPFAVRFGDVEARWFAERGVLEWIEGRVHTAVTVPLGDLETATAVAERLR
ncbi:MAG TPA: anti-sigma factor [Actinomycetota bacterium]|nr:anti-sigma factor [Actinomycetota bacterium]